MEKTLTLNVTQKLSPTKLLEVRSPEQNFQLTKRITFSYPNRRDSLGISGQVKETPASPETRMDNRFEGLRTEGTAEVRPPTRDFCHPIVRYLLLFLLIKRNIAVLPVRICKNSRRCVRWSWTAYILRLSHGRPKCPLNNATVSTRLFAVDYSLALSKPEFRC